MIFCNMRPPRSFDNSPLKDVEIVVATSDSAQSSASAYYTLTVKEAVVVTEKPILKELGLKIVGTNAAEINHTSTLRDSVGLLSWFNGDMGNGGNKVSNWIGVAGLGFSYVDENGYDIASATQFGALKCDFKVNLPKSLLNGQVVSGAVKVTILGGGNNTLLGTWTGELVANGTSPNETYTFTVAIDGTKLNP